MSSKKVQQDSLVKAKAALFMIANAMIVHEALVAGGSVKGLHPLSSIDTKDPVKWLEQEWENILKITNDYEPIFKPALKLLKILPRHPYLMKIIVEMSGKAGKAVSTMAVFKQDLAGRLYHTLLLRKIAKSLATYYTSIQAATLLARLAFSTLNSVDWSNLEAISRLCVADFACGSGTLLSAAYTEIMDRYIASSQQPNLKDLHKVLLENVLWGFDVLDYAVHLASATLVLRDPRMSISHTNTFVLPLGIRQGSYVYLGSLDLIDKGDYLTFPLIQLWLGSTTPLPEKATIEKIDSTRFQMPKPDIVIMNPPFARTGNVGKSVLFGHLREAERREVLDKLRELGEELRKKLHLSSGFGRAGLASYFLLKSYMALKDQGVLAFVLPRVFLSGSDWAPVREFLIKGGEYAYVVVSDDPKNYWAWSENTNLSEILLVYKKTRSQKELKTAVAFVRKRPRSALEARVLADLIINASKNTGVSSGGYSQTKIVKLESPSQTIPSLPMGAMPPILAYTYTVDRKIIEEVADKNLNLAIGFHTAELSSAAYWLYKQHSFLTAQLPLKTLPDYLSEWMAELDVCFGQERVKRGGHKKPQDYIGYDVRQVKDKCLDKGNIPIKALMEINKDTFSSLEVPHSSLKLTHVPRECFCRAGRLHIPGVARFWLKTIGVISAYTPEPSISQVTWTIPLSLEDAKVQALWLNTTPGLLHVLSLRQDSKGGFVQIKKEILGNLLLLDVGRLETSQKEDLLRIADILNGKRLPRLFDQFNEATKKQGIRYFLDKNFLKLFGVDIEKDDIAWQKMKELYEQLAEETLLEYSTKYPI
jgi:hypothetical protein